MKILGWQCVAKKGDFKPGDYAIFCEIDTLLPDVPEFEFMRQTKFKVRTRRFKGCLSQGLLLKLDDPYVVGRFASGEQITLKEGTDLTEKLGFMKWEPPANASIKGEVAGSFPTHIVPKTDEMRIQSVPRLLEEYAGRFVYFTEKCDGTSFTAFLKNGEFGVCSRNLQMKHDGNNIYSRIAIKYEVEKKLRFFHEKTGIELAVQGEICGPHIQENRMKLKEHQLFLFNIWDINQHQYLDYADFLDAAGELGLPTVRVLGQEAKFAYTIDELLERARGNYPDTIQPREGIVVRPVFEAYSGVLEGRMSFKVINNDFLLKGGA